MDNIVIDNYDIGDIEVAVAGVTTLACPIKVRDVEEGLPPLVLTVEATRLLAAALIEAADAYELAEKEAGV